MFLDSHCEMGAEWLEPLMQTIKRNKKILASPQIDAINFSDFKVQKGQFYVGGFDWNFRFKWDVLTKEQSVEQKDDYGQNLVTPTIAGGIFAIGNL